MLPGAANTPAQSLIILGNSFHVALAIVVLVKGPRMTLTVVPFFAGTLVSAGCGMAYHVMGPSLDLTKLQVYTLHTSYDFGLNLEMVKCGDISEDLFIFLVSPQSTAASQYVIHCIPIG